MDLENCQKKILEADRERTNNIDQFVCDLTEEWLFRLAKLAGIEFDHRQWLDDEWPDREDEIRTQLMERIGDIEI